MTRDAPFPVKILSRTPKREVWSWAQFDITSLIEFITNTKSVREAKFKFNIFKIRFLIENAAILRVSNFYQKKVWIWFFVVETLAILWASTTASFAILTSFVTKHSTNNLICSSVKTPGSISSDRTCVPRFHLKHSGRFDFPERSKEERVTDSSVLLWGTKWEWIRWQISRFVSPKKSTQSWVGLLLDIFLNFNISRLLTSRIIYPMARRDSMILTFHVPSVKTLHKPAGRDYVISIEYTVQSYSEKCQKIGKSWHVEIRPKICVGLIWPCKDFPFFKYFLSNTELYTIDIT